jgi:two-component system, chemotaxis family, protein-glutamate methylesterase/glutaminase
MAASAGGIQATKRVLAGLPPELNAAVILVQHRSPHGKSYLDKILQQSSRMPVMPAREGQTIKPGTVYIARPDLHLTVTVGHRFRYRDGHKIRFVLSSANPLLESAATVFKDHLIAVVLTGTGADATDGVQCVKVHGGLVIVQDKGTSEHWDMPEAALRSGAVNYVLPLEAIGPALDAIVHGRPVSTGASAA